MTHAASPRRLIILGSTGSIGRNTLSVVDHLHRNKVKSFEIVGLGAGANVRLLREQQATYQVPAVALCNGGGDSRNLGFSRDVTVFCGENSADELVRHVARPGDLVVGAIVGVAGLRPILTAIELGCDIALANKETLVAGGELVIPEVQRQGVNLLPIDSEHSGLFQCLYERGGFQSLHSRGQGRPGSLRRIILTASGGPFRTWEQAQIERATLNEALAHPTWAMGAKNTIDSASLMNKALEVIEAHWLMHLWVRDQSPEISEQPVTAGVVAEGNEPRRIGAEIKVPEIDVLIHPQSIVHSLVEFIDGSVIAQLSRPDMRVPIQYALTWPQRYDSPPSGASTGSAGTRDRSTRIDWTELSRLDFETPDLERFPALGLGWDVIRRGGTAGAIMNAANEVAVAAFIDGRVSFGRIAEVVCEVLNQLPIHTVKSIDDIMAADREARIAAQERTEVRSHQRSAGTAEHRVPSTEF